MVMTTPPSPTSSSALDGFANLDTQEARATVLFGGVNDGTVQIVVKGFQAATFFGTRVRAVVEHTPFASRTTVVNATNTLSTADLTVSNNQITVSVSGANNSDGYRLSLTPVGGSSVGGSSAAGGASATGGTRAAGGTSGFGGSRNTGGAVATGGTPATGGASTSSNTGGASTATNATGGVVGLTGGATSVVGSVGGQWSSGGANATGGIFSVGGQLGNAGRTNDTGPNAGVVDTDNASESSGCGCRVASERSNSQSLAALGLFGLVFRRARRQRLAKARRAG
jgi:MYXO-CTERM domain-containing protein